MKTLALPVAGLLLLLGVPSAPAAAQHEVAYPALGLHFEVPAGWQGQEGDGVYLLTHPDVLGGLALMPHEATTLAELRAGARDGLDAGAGASLRPSGPVEDFGADGVRADLVGVVEGDLVEAHAIGRLSPYGRGVVVVALAPQGRFSDAYRGYAEALARSVAFAAPEVPPAVQAWADGLRGVELRRYGTSSGSSRGSSTKETLALCDGRFRYTRDSFLYGTTTDVAGQVDSAVGAASERAEEGAWTVEADPAGQPVLRLAYDDGTVETYALAEADGALYLDGEEVLHTDAVCD